jgi:ribosomal protein L7/L12
VPDDVVQLIRAGQKIAAIKLYRERTGVGLKEAKDAIDALAGAAPMRSLQAVGSAAGDLSTVEDHLRAGQKIQAIKQYREQTGAGLKEAKDAVEAMQQRLL